MRETLSDLEGTLFGIVAFITSASSSTWGDLTDFENGPTISQLLALNFEVGRLSLVREKHQVNAMTVSLTSLFDSEVLKGYNTKMDDVIGGLDIFSDRPGPVTPADARKTSSRQTPRRRTRASQRAAAQHTVKELSKLNALFGMGG